MIRTIGKILTPVLALAAAGLAGRAGTVLGTELALGDVTTVFVAGLLAILGFLAVLYGYFLLFVEREVEGPTLDADSIRAYSSLRRE